MSNAEGQELPSQFGRYTLIQRLAVGGMAEVFRAKIFSTHGFEKILVIKRILPHLAADKTFVSMFIDEAKLTAQLAHPKIVQVTDFGEVNGQYFIALEFIDGFDALALLRTSAHRRIRLPVHLGVFIAQEMLDALDYAHNAVDGEGRPMKLVHRDISPSNVFISRRGDVKLGDFGIAHAQERESKTQAGTLKGKYGYMSPEQVTGAQLDGRSDLFAVGIVLAEMLMGRRLFTAANDLDVLLMVRDGRLERLDKYCKDLPGALDDIVRKSLKKALPERFQTAAEFRDALGDFLFQIGKRTGPPDLGAFTKDLFDESPEALRRLQEQQAKLKEELARAPRGPGGSAPPSAAPAAAAAPAPAPASLPSATGWSLVAEQAGAAAPAIAPAPAPVHAPAPAPPFEPASDPVPPMDLELDVGDDEPDQAIQLDADDLQPMAEMRAPRAEPDPRIAAALDNAFSSALAIVDLDQWGTDSDVGGGGTGSRGAAWTPSPAGTSRPPTGGGPRGMLPPAATLTPAARANIGRFTPGHPARPPDSAGDLSVISPMRVFADLAVARETGLVRLEVPPHVKEVYIVEGAPQSINSSLPGERFGEFLVAQGVLRPDQLEQALTMLPRFGGKLGETLAGLGFLKSLDVFRYLQQQVRDRVIDVFSWTEGSFGFYRGVTNAHEAFPLGLDAFEILGAGVLMLGGDFLQDRVAAFLDYRPRAAPRPRIVPEQFRLGPTPREVMMMLDGTRSLRQWLAHFSGADESLTFLRTLYLLMETDLIGYE